MSARKRQVATSPSSSLDLALIGNGTIAALVDPAGEIKWTCFPRFDGDPAFCSLLNGDKDRANEFGLFRIDLVDSVRTEQEYLMNTPILVTRSFDSEGGAIEITDFAPRFRQYGRLFCPMMIVRQVRRIGGNPPHSDQAAARPGLRVRTPANNDRQQSHPLLRRGRRAAAHDRCVHHRGSR